MARLTSTAGTWRDRRHRWVAVRRRRRSTVFHCAACGQFAVRRRSVKPLARLGLELRRNYLTVLQGTLFQPSALLDLAHRRSA